MYTLAAGSSASATTEVKRSQFLTVVARVEDEDEARTVIDEQKIFYPDARHHCSAYVLQSSSATPRTHSSDDGEPAGTAGAPILEVLLGADLVDVVAVVTRYFGGTLLGTGGLVRAYGGATQAALENAEIVRITKVPRFKAEIDLANAGKVEATLRRQDWHILDLKWGNTLIAYFAVPSSNAKEEEAQERGAQEKVESLIASVTRAEPKVEFEGWLDIEVPK